LEAASRNKMPKGIARYNNAYIRHEAGGGYKDSLNAKIEEAHLRLAQEEKRARVIAGIIKYKEEQKKIEMEK